MSIARKFVVALLLALTLLVGAPAAAAHSAGETIHYRTRAPVSFTLTPACATIHSDVMGTGEITHNIHGKIRADGSKRVVDDAIARGTAVDSAGKTYRFLYVNQTISTVPASGSPVQVQMRDSFRLHGRDGVNKVNVGFLWRWTYMPQNDDIPTSDSPGIWPPVDNWQQISTHGDPFTCDPL
jgi:hypothetical protein